MFLLPNQYCQVASRCSRLYVCAERRQPVCQSFINGTADLTIGKTPVQLVQQNNYPWDGALAFIVNPEKTVVFNLLVRIPGWAQNTVIPSDLYQFEDGSAAKPVIKVNGQPVEYIIQNGNAVIGGTWKKNNLVNFDLPM